MNAFVKLVLLLLRWFDVYRQKKEQKKKQAERDELEADAFNWYRDHFNGVRDVQDRKDKPCDTDSKPDKS